MRAAKRATTPRAPLAATTDVRDERRKRTKRVAELRAATLYTTVSLDDVAREASAPPSLCYSCAGGAQPSLVHTLRRRASFFRGLYEVYCEAFEFGAAFADEAEAHEARERVAHLCVRAGFGAVRERWCAGLRRPFARPKAQRSLLSHRQGNVARVWRPVSQLSRCCSTLARAYCPLDAARTADRLTFVCACRCLRLEALWASVCGVLRRARRCSILHVVLHDHNAAQDSEPLFGFEECVGSVGVVDDGASHRKKMDSKCSRADYCSLLCNSRRDCAGFEIVLVPLNISALGSEAGRVLRRRSPFLRIVGHAFRPLLCGGNCGSCTFGAPATDERARMKKEKIYSPLLVLVCCHHFRSRPLRLALSKGR